MSKKTRRRHGSRNNTAEARRRSIRHNIAVWGELEAPSISWLRHYERTTSKRHRELHRRAIAELRAG